MKDRRDEREWVISACFWACSLKEGQSIALTEGSNGERPEVCQKFMEAVRDFLHDFYRIRCEVVPSNDGVMWHLKPLDPVKEPLPETPRKTARKSPRPRKAR